MILTAIEVQGWRCLANRCRLGDFGDRLNVVHAPNGAGKSTIFEALRRALFDGYKVSGEGAEQLRSWGRELAPSVTIDFSHAGHRYRLMKRFLNERAAELWRIEDGKLVRYAEGDAADAAARAIFAGEEAGRGLSKEKHWGLAQVLWAPQGSLSCAELSGGLLANIRGSLDLQVADSASGDLEKAIERRYLEFFTPAGNLRKGAGAMPWISREAALPGLQSRRDELAQKVSDLEEASRRLAELRARRERAAQDEEAALAALKKARGEAQRHGILTTEKMQREGDLARLAVEHREQSARIAQITERRSEVAACDQKIERLGAELPDLAERAEHSAQAAELATEGLRKAQAAEAAIEGQRRKIEITKGFLHACAECERLAGLLAEIDRAVTMHAQATCDLAQLVAPDEGALQSIRAGIARSMEAAALFEASLITLEIILDHDGVVTAISGEESGQRKLAAGTSCEIKGAPEVIVKLEGFGVIKARGPADSAEDLRANAQKAAQRVKLTQPYGTAQLIELEALHDRLKQQRQVVRNAEGRLNALLSGRTREELAQEYAGQKGLIAETLAMHRSWESKPPDAVTMLEELGRLQRSAEPVSAAGAAWEAAHKKSAEARQALLLCRANLENAQTQRQTSQRALERLIEDGVTDAARSAALHKVALQWDAARASLEGVREKLALFAEDPAVSIRSLENQIAGIRAQTAKSWEDETLEKGRLQTLTNEAPYSALATIDEEIARHQADVAAGKVAADAIKLLRETVARCRAEALATVSGPVEMEALTILQRVAGRRFSGVHLGDALQLHQVSSIAHSERISPEILSAGEQEQVHFAVRLALAQVLAARERQLVVLDDVLIATDATRLTRILAVLQELSHRLQIIILTCHPERYSGFDETSRFFDLEKIKLCG